ncbi:MAG: hypothetical protein JST62_12480 [Bacteroidetes bacterium]|nr:hypothetical protein [Bacteroidota bacterium]
MNKIIALTICSNNFLAQAKTMLDSLEVQHPEIKKYIFLVDIKDATIDYSFLHPAELVVVNEEIVHDFNSLVKQLSVIELNSAIRPFVFQYLIDKNIDAQRFYYIDPDVYIYSRLDLLDKLLESEDLIITPHFLSPISIDGNTPSENLALNYGTFNLGFLALNPKSDSIKQFLFWWGERTKRFGYIDVTNGYFVDQIWFNLVPVYFSKVYVLKHPGFNMACWNLHEREIAQYTEDGKVFLKSGDELVFYHFSLWTFFKPDQLCKNFTRFDFNNRKDLELLYYNYYQKLKKNNIEYFSKINCKLSFKNNTKQSFLKRLMTPSAQLMKKFWQKL